MGLSRSQKQRLTEKKLASIKRGWAKWRQIRVDRTEEIKRSAIQEISGLSSRDLWLIGIALYWAEGSKERDSSIGNGVRFNNSDPLMVRLFLKWLRDIIKVNNSDIKCEIYIHKNSKNRIGDVIRFWAKTVDIPEDKLIYYFKKNKIKTKRKNIGSKYFGLVRITVRKSSILNRRIAGWTEGICKNYRVY